MNAEHQRARRFDHGEPAEERIQLPQHDERKDSQLPDTAHGSFAGPGEGRRDQ